MQDGVDMTQQLWIEDAKEQLLDNERVIQNLRERVAELETCIKKFRPLVWAAYCETSGVCFEPENETPNTKRNKKAADKK
jgi:hypothetical protein